MPVILAAGRDADRAAEAAGTAAQEAAVPRGRGRRRFPAGAARGQSRPAPAPDATRPGTDVATSNVYA